MIRKTVSKLCSVFSHCIKKEHISSSFFQTFRFASNVNNHWNAVNDLSSLTSRFRNWFVFVPLATAHKPNHCFFLLLGQQCSFVVTVVSNSINFNKLRHHNSISAPLLIVSQWKFRFPQSCISWAFILANRNPENVPSWDSILKQIESFDDFWQQTSHFHSTLLTTIHRLWKWNLLRLSQFS